jgi:hypothetical protein
MQPSNKSIQTADSPQWNAPQLTRLGHAQGANGGTNITLVEGGELDFAYAPAS